MSILINGMEMPTSCGYCPFKYRTMEGDECMFNVRSTEYQKRPDDCPIIPVPPHGRLIDADALKKSAYPFPCAIGTEWAVTLRQINDAPTIIPAEEEE